MTHRRAVLLIVFWLWCCVVIAAFVVASHAHQAQRQVPMATEVDEALAGLALSRDGKEITVLPRIHDEVQICIEQRAGVFGPKRCFTVGAIRRGDLVLRQQLRGE